MGIVKYDRSKHIVYCLMRLNHLFHNWYLRKKINKITDIIMFEGASNVRLSGDPLNIYYPKLTIMC